MTNLPATQETALVAALGNQAALFDDDPDRLLTLDVPSLRKLAALVGHEVKPAFAQIRRYAGLVAWAGWHRFNAKDYKAFLAGFATALGTDVRTLSRWRDAVVTKLDLTEPGVVRSRREEAKGEDKTAGQDPCATTFVTNGREHIEPVETGKVDPFPASAPSAPREAARNGSGRVVPPEPQSAPARPAERPITDAEGLRWLTSKTDAQVRAMGDPYGPATRAEVCRWAAAWGYDGQDVRAVAGAVAARRSGTITRPADQLLAPTNGGCSHPRDHQQNKGYAIVCGLCHARVR